MLPQQLTPIPQHWVPQQLPVAQGVTPAQHVYPGGWQLLEQQTALGAQQAVPQQTFGASQQVVEAQQNPGLMQQLPLQQVPPEQALPVSGLVVQLPLVQTAFLQVGAEHALQAAPLLPHWLTLCW